MTYEVQFPSPLKGEQLHTLLGNYAIQYRFAVVKTKIVLHDQLQAIGTGSYFMGLSRRFAGKDIIFEHEQGNRFDDHKKYSSIKLVPVQWELRREKTPENKQIKKTVEPTLERFIIQSLASSNLDS